MTRTLYALILVFIAGSAGAQTPGEVPNDQLTPGVVASTHEVEVCGHGAGGTYSQQHRATPQSLKREIRERDGCDPHNSEVDHRCALALGCADVKENLWCQPGTARGVVWDFHDKDRLEVYAWNAVCRHHTMPLAKAQAMFLAPAVWTEEYCKVFDDERCP